MENYVTCKVCKGSGSIQDPLNFASANQTPCRACKGAGLIPRPILQSNGETFVTKIDGSLPRPKIFEFDVALSFAGEDRKVAESYSQFLKGKGLRVFVDSDEQAELWGADLYVRLDEVYRKKAMFCVMFISKHYAVKRWTNHERRSAQVRAFKENEEYILPVRLDDTQIPGLPETIGYIDLRKKSMEDLVKLTLQKIERQKKRP